MKRQDNYHRASFDRELTKIEIRKWRAFQTLRSTGAVESKKRRYSSPLPKLTLNSFGGSQLWWPE